MGVRAAFFFCAALVTPSLACGQVIISEVMYDLEGSDSGREWIEVFNTGGGSVNLADWKLFENNSNHSIVAYSGGETLASGAYAILADNPAKFLEDWPGFGGLLFDTTFSFSNAGETLTLRCCGSDAVDVDSVSYTAELGGAGDGQTLHRKNPENTALTPAAPSPGAGSLSVIEGSTNDSPSSGSSAAETQTDAQTSGTTSSVQEVSVDGGTDRFVIALSDISFKASAYNRSKNSLEDVSFMWNFGDGSTAPGAAVVHRFEYPGKYVVVVMGSKDGVSGVDRFTVTAESAQLALRVLPDMSIEIKNTAVRDIDLSRWIIQSSTNRFMFPENSLVLSKQTMRIAPQTLHFYPGSTTEIAYPSGAVAFSAEMEATRATTTHEVAVEYKEVSQGSEDLLEDDAPQPDAVEQVPERQSIETQDQTVSATTSQVAAAARVAPGGRVWWIGALGLSIFAAGAVVFARRFGKTEWNIIEESSD